MAMLTETAAPLASPDALNASNRVSERTEFRTPRVLRFDGPDRAAYPKGDMP